MANRYGSRLIHGLFSSGGQIQGLGMKVFSRLQSTGGGLMAKSPEAENML